MGERKLAVLMKKMKESVKLDINKRLTNHSARKFLLQQLRENNVEGRAIMQIGHTNVASINYYSKKEWGKPQANIKNPQQHIVRD